jgi:hypothetical protein
METLNISISKGKIMASRIGLGSLFLILCILFYMGWVNEWSWVSVLPLFDHLFVMIVLGLCTAIMGFGAFWMFFKLDSSKPALILENDGYIDNVGITKGQKYFYKDIDRFEDKTVNMNRCIVVYLKDVDAFLEAQTGFKKKMMKATYTQMGSPISIPARGFDYKFEDLLAELNKRLATNR